MAFRMSAKVVIGNLEFRYVESVEIESTWKNLTDYCTIVVPKRVRLIGVNTNEPITKFIKTGQSVEVWLGYDGELNKEFEGFVVSIKAGENLEIKAQDWFWLLKRKYITMMNGSGSIKEVVERMFAEGVAMSDDQVNKAKQAPPPAVNSSFVGGNPLGVHSNAFAMRNLSPDVVFPYALDSPYANPLFAMTSSEEAAEVSFVRQKIREIEVVNNEEGFWDLPWPYSLQIQKMTVAEVFEQLKRETGFYLWFRGNKLHLNTWLGTVDGEAKDVRRHNYRIRWNVISTNLAYQEAEDVKVNVQVSSINKNGKVVVGQAGSTYSKVQRFYTSMGMSQEQADKKAELAKKMLMYDGLRGDFETFGFPFARHSDLATLYDSQGELTGTYQIIEVKTSFSSSGFRRKVKLGSLEEEN